MLFVATEATLSIARPREQGSLQVLFFAPIDETILIIGNFLTGLLVYLLFVILTIPFLLLLVWVANFAIPTILLWALVPTVFAVAAALSFGLFLSAAAPSARAAVLILVAGILILLGLQSAYTALLNIPPTSRFFDALLFIRSILASLQTILAWISPIRMLDVILKASLNQDWLELFRQIGIALLSTVVWLFAARTHAPSQGGFTMSLKVLKTGRSKWSFLAILLVLALPTVVLAQDIVDREESFVYGINAGIPDAVIGTFAPPTVDTIYLMSTETSILSPRITSIYYWPITNDYRASWNLLNEVVEGELEIVRGLQTVETVEQVTYTIHFHQGRGSSSRPSLFIGDAAIEAYEQFQADQDAYRGCRLGI